MREIVKNNMTERQILQKAIEKAVKNGWKWYPNVMTFQNTPQGIIWVSTAKNVNDIIFSKDFAKAFWGEGNDCDCDWRSDPERTIIPNSYCPVHLCRLCNCGHLKDSNWQYRLQQMVISENPIKYLEQYLED